MPITDTRKTIIQIINESRRKLGLPAVTAISDAQSTVALDYLNDVIAITSDYGDWQEALSTVTVTASTSVIAYTVSATVPIKNIHEVAFEGLIPPLKLRTIDEMRRWQRTGGTGAPRNWAIVGLDQSTGNPIVQVYPMPGATENNQTFDVLFYKKPPIYTSADVSVIPYFPSQLLVNGLTAMLLLDESRGTTNTDFLVEFMKLYEPSLEEAYNRFNGDSGSTIHYRIPPGGRTL